MRRPRTIEPSIIRLASCRRGFTLIELLIVVAIIAILAAIALPNFLEAQVRAKVSRVKSDLRSLAAALEAYYSDNQSYPWRAWPSPTYDKWYTIGARCSDLTTPIAYLTNVDFTDPFIEEGTSVGYTDGFIRTQYNYRNYQFYGSLTGTPPTNPILGVQAWALNSLGPARRVNSCLNIEFSVRGLPGFNPGDPNYAVVYDPSNGTISHGGIPRTGGDTRYANP